IRGSEAVWVRVHRVCVCVCVCVCVWPSVKRVCVAQHGKQTQVLTVSVQCTVPAIRVEFKYLSPGLSTDPLKTRSDRWRRVEAGAWEVAGGGVWVVLWLRGGGMWG